MYYISVLNEIELVTIPLVTLFTLNPIKDFRVPLTRTNDVRAKPKYTPSGQTFSLTG